MMEKWQCQKTSKFSEMFVFKDPNTLQHWQQGRPNFVTACCLLKEDPDLQDYDEEVTIESKDLFKKGLINGKYNFLEKETQWSAHYRMIIPLKTKGKLKIKMTFEISKVGDDVTNQDIEKTKKLILNINKVWNGNFAFKLTNIHNHYCPVELPIEFDIQFAYQGEKIANGEKYPHQIELYTKIPIFRNKKRLRPHLDRGQTFFLETDPSVFSNLYTYSHEFGHALGLPDEYGYDLITDSVVHYYKPDGSLDQKEYIAFHDGKDRLLNDPQESIMSVFQSCRITERLGWVIGIAAKKIINNKHYRYDIIFKGSNKSCDARMLK